MTKPTEDAPEERTDILPFALAGRDTKGRFVPGVSGNPAGRAVDRVNKITSLKQELEIAVRENMTPYQISQIVHRMYEAAMNGSVGAAKLILDKFVTNATGSEEAEMPQGGLTIRIENMTMAHETPEPKPVIDVEVEDAEIVPTTPPKEI